MMEGGTGDSLRKRKGSLMLEDPELPLIKKSSRLMVEDDPKPEVATISRTHSPVLLGAKSRIGGETTAMQCQTRRNGNGKGLDLFGKTEKEGIEKHVNTFREF